MVVPLSRPKLLCNVLHNFWRQKCVEKKLCIIENGPAVGVCARYGLEPNLLLSASSGPSVALNVALNELTRMGEHSSWYCKIDDDDYYGAGYLSQIVESPPWADMVGKAMAWFSTAGGRLRLFEFRDPEIPTGPTLAARVAQCVEFRDVRPWGEDIAWFTDMRRAGARGHLTGRRWFCQRRWGWPHGHTWLSTDDQIRAMAWRERVYDAGDFDSQVVDGNVEPKLVPVPGPTGAPTMEELSVWQFHNRPTTNGSNSTGHATQVSEVEQCPF